MIHDLAFAGRLQSFRQITSYNMALSSDRSATIRFSLAFSSSSWRSRFISDGSGRRFLARAIVKVASLIPALRQTSHRLPCRPVPAAKQKRYALP